MQPFFERNKKNVSIAFASLWLSQFKVDKTLILLQTKGLNPHFSGGPHGSVFYISHEHRSLKWWTRGLLGREVTAFTLSPSPSSRCLSRQFLSPKMLSLSVPPSGLEPLISPSSCSPSTRPCPESTGSTLPYSRVIIQNNIF